MRPRLFRFILPLLVLSCGLYAQTYSPKVVRFDGVKAYAQADLLAVAQLKPGTSLTSGDIDAALQRLADTGLFAESKYSVSPAELKITLMPIAASATLPVRYGNFVWWAPGELTPLVHARVPLFNGVLPLNGNLQDDVKKALQSLLTEKGIAAAAVEMRSSTDRPGGPVTALTYAVMDPQVRIGTIHFEGASADAAPQLAKLQVKLAEDDYDDVETPKAVVNDAEQIYRDDGFLDIAVSEPVRSAPRKVDSGRWVVDLSATVKGGELYRVADVVVHAAPPVSAGELSKVLTLKVGSPASAGEFRLTSNQLVGPYLRVGYLDAKAQAEITKDIATHKVTYTFTMTPGEVYHISVVRTSGMTSEQQEVVAKAFEGAVGSVMDDSFYRRLIDVQHSRAFSGQVPKVSTAPDRVHHTVAVTLGVGRPTTR